MSEESSSPQLMPLPGAPTFFRIKEEDNKRPASMEVTSSPFYGFARKIEELYKPVGPKKPKHTFTSEELADIESKPPEAYLAKPPRVRAWNAQKSKTLNLPGAKQENKNEAINNKSENGNGNKQVERWSSECVAVSFQPSEGKRVTQIMSMELTSNEIKAQLFEIAGIKAKVEDYDLRIPVINHRISLDNLALRRQTFIQACILSRISPVFEVIAKVASKSTEEETRDVKKHIQVELDIFELVGIPLARTLDQHKPEVVHTRRALAALRLAVIRCARTARDAQLQQFVYVDSEPMPLVIPNTVTVIAQLPFNAIRTTVSVDPTLDVEEARNKIFKKFSLIDRQNSQGKSAEDYVLKATGFREYILPNLDLGTDRHFLSTKDEKFKLIDFDIIRKCISKGNQIELTLVAISDLREQLAEEEPESIIDHILCAEFDDDQEKTQASKAGGINFDDADDPPFPSLFNSRPIPSTKMHRSFRIKACCVRDARIAREDVFTKFEKSEKKTEPSIYVKMEIFHGGQPLCPPVLTPLAPSANDYSVLVYPQWDEWREFPIKISDLPKAAILSVTVYATDSDLGWTASSDAKGVPIGWGNIQLVDFDGCLRMGLYARKLWEDGAANPIGTCMDNLKKNAAVFLLEFETFVRPLVYPDPLLPAPPPMAPNSPSPTASPNSSPPSSPVISHVQEFRKSSLTLSSSQLGLPPFRKLETSEARQLQMVLNYDPLTLLTPSDKKLLWNFRSLCRPKYKALPKFLQAVAWSDTEQVAETHRLLDMWAIPPPVLAL